MQNKKLNHWQVKVALVALDLLAVVTAYFSAYYVRFWSPLYSTFRYVPIDYYLYALPVAAVVFLGSFAFLGLYDIRKPTGRLTLFLDCFRAVTLGSLLVLPLSFWVRAFTFSRWVVILNWLFLLVLSPLLRGAFQRVAESLRRKGWDQVPLLVIGTGEQARLLVETLQGHPELGYQVVGALHSRNREASRLQNLPVLGELENLVQVLDEYQVEEVAIADEGLDPRQEFLILQPCRAEDIRIRVVPALYDFALGTRGLRVIDNLFWYSLEPTASQRWYQWVKRGIDMTISLLVLIPIGILYPLIALVIRLDSPGSIIFCQQRTGTNGKPFTMYKFRSMVSNAEEILPSIVNLQTIARPAFKLENDPRVTRVGRFLRRFSLDELPQFYNVLRGDMSLVGPRPEELWIAGKYNEKERARLQVKPGITGFQQIRCRGTEDFDDRLRHDLYYINNQSLMLDLSILLETLWVVFCGKGRF